MKPLLFLTITALVCGCASVHHATYPSTISKIESRELPADEVERIVLEQISDVLIFTQPRSRPGRPPRLPLEDMWFSTRPHATEYLNLCTAQQVVVDFRNAEPERGAETQVRAVGLRTTSLFQFLAPPSDPELFAEDYSQDAACAHLDRWEDEFFEAEDAHDAYNGAYVFALLRQQASMPNLELTCTTTREPCHAQLQETLFSEIESIRRCDGRESQCFAIEAGGYVTYLNVRRAASGGEPLRWSIQSAHVAELIILVHERSD